MFQDSPQKRPGRRRCRKNHIPQWSFPRTSISGIVLPKSSSSTAVTSRNSRRHVSSGRSPVLPANRTKWCSCSDLNRRLASFIAGADTPCHSLSATCLPGLKAIIIALTDDLFIFELEKHSAVSTHLRTNRQAAKSGCQRGSPEHFHLLRSRTAKVTRESQSTTHGAWPRA